MTLYYILRRVLLWGFIFLFGLFFWRRCGGEALFAREEQPAVRVTHNTVLTSIEDLGKLELVRYNFKDVVEYEKAWRWLPNSKSVLIIAGEAVGCLDLTKVTAQDITFSGDTLVTVRLPEPEICYYKVDHSQSKVFALENTYFQDAELVDEGFRFAEANVRQAAEASGILRQTAINADKVLKPMLESLTGRRVVLVPKTTIRNPEIPARR
jgi:hypothetical protein